MLVTLFGIVILIKLEQLKKSWLFKIVMLLGKVTVTKYAQNWNAPKPILVTLFGIDTLIKLLQLLNAFEPMLITLYTIEANVIVEGIVKAQFEGGLENPVTEALLLFKKVYITFWYV